MDLLTLSYYFSLFPNEGHLGPLRICKNDDTLFTSQTNFQQDKQIISPQYIQLVNKILTDRQTGVDQFGMKSNLNIANIPVAVKTGTSREFHDSWTVGYTKDFVVGVWIGNTENTAMDSVSGADGAGKIWNEIMQLMINSKYSTNAPFNFNLLTEFNSSNAIVYGLPDDQYTTYQNLLTENVIILEPYNNDSFLFESSTQIPLRAKEEVTWQINGEISEINKEMVFRPHAPGLYTIEAILNNGIKETIQIYINSE